MADCSGCGSNKSRVVRTWWDKELQKIQDACDICAGIGAGAGPADVFYPYGSGVHVEENIAYPRGHAQEGKPIPFSSKRGKAEAMKRAGVREAGDKVHGARHDSSMVPKNRKTFFT
jgi:hypothetical protein